MFPDTLDRPWMISTISRTVTDHVNVLQPLSQGKVRGDTVWILKKTLDLLCLTQRDAGRITSIGIYQACKLEIRTRTINHQMNFDENSSSRW